MSLGQVWDVLLHGDKTSMSADRGFVSATREALFLEPVNSGN